MCGENNSGASIPDSPRGMTRPSLDNAFVRTFSMACQMSTGELSGSSHAAGNCDAIVVDIGPSVPCCGLEGHLTPCRGRCRCASSDMLFEGHLAPSVVRRGVSCAFRGASRGMTCAMLGRPFAAAELLLCWTRCVHGLKASALLEAQEHCESLKVFPWGPALVSLTRGSNRGAGKTGAKSGCCRTRHLRARIRTSIVATDVDTADAYVVVLGPFGSPVSGCWPLLAAIPMPPLRDRHACARPSANRRAWLRDGRVSRLVPQRRARGSASRA